MTTRITASPADMGIGCCECNYYKQPHTTIAVFLNTITIEKM